MGSEVPHVRQKQRGRPMQANGLCSAIWRNSQRFSSPQWNFHKYLLDRQGKVVGLPVPQRHDT